MSESAVVTSSSAPFRLKPFFSPRPWGKPNLKPWYEETGTTELVGEAWLTGPQCVVETGPLAGRTLGDVAEEYAEELLTPGALAEFPLLVKMLFPDAKLSVQVHPDDAEAQAIGLHRGKTECWYVLEAEPGATIALGLKPGTTLDGIRAAVADGSMESLMEWVPVKVGEMIFVDAGTVHAIGPGVVLLETQQTCDTTYRLYDYRRPRELHLEKGLAVTKLHTAAGKVAPVEMDGFTRVITQKYFVVDRFEVAAGATVSLGDVSGVSECLVCLKGSGTVKSNEGSVELGVGEAVVVPATAYGVEVVAGEKLTFFRCFEPKVG
ncbi:type I phosphomannose isomerase catalytic subunit [Granulicella aggregans]|uniref:type I phosphomannose isomerase catalytic subunit n=1 Tax=Granulicella aggregans TaxID=474949 RepID=UPI0021E0004B|nr:type I phosphomannose isomerase catalytic subunit [Granulicella aggregans]